MRHSTTIFLTLSFVFPILAHPLLTSCNCAPPLFPTTIHWLFRYSPRSLTPKQCAFICNPSAVTKYPFPSSANDVIRLAEPDLSSSSTASDPTPDAAGSAEEPQGRPDIPCNEPVAVKGKHSRIRHPHARPASEPAVSLETEQARTDPKQVASLPSMRFMPRPSGIFKTMGIKSQQAVQNERIVQSKKYHLWVLLTMSYVIGGISLLALVMTIMAGAWVEYRMWQERRASQEGLIRLSEENKDELPLYEDLDITSLPITPGTSAKSPLTPRTPWGKASRNLCTVHGKTLPVTPRTPYTPGSGRW